VRPRDNTLIGPFQKPDSARVNGVTVQGQRQ